MEKWVRTCQECGNKQEDNPPDRNKELTVAYETRKCKKCKSESLDYGSYKDWCGFCQKYDCDKEHYISQSTNGY